MSKSMHSAMEQSRYWMWGTRKSMCSDPRDDSWEERAFAADAAGGLNWYTWPPRSYPCSFCRREFRSAQALGGHMNVHRRDRARLKASSPPNSHEEEESRGGYPLHLPRLPLVYDSNPNFDVVSPLPSHFTSKVDGRNKDAELRRKHSILSTPGPFDLTLVMDCSYGSVRKRVRDEVAEESWLTLNQKRPRIHEFVDDCDRHQPTVPNLCHSPIEELDLELRL